MNPPDAFNLTKRQGRAQAKLNLMKTKFLLADRFTVCCFIQNLLMFEPLPSQRNESVMPNVLQMHRPV